ncbi:histidine acid phosphatase [Ancylostoma caninum]|uniref:Histidine acid phosphatase n=1 Tax=Ancylostoma caninum TaxID=29170 RepID=A0A368GIN7_ANCCA|nr:histidine acid phosphatase [Ancylostoma caninum]
MSGQFSEFLLRTFEDRGFPELFQVTRKLHREIQVKYQDGMGLGMTMTLLFLLISLHTAHSELVFVTGLWMHGDVAPGAVPYPKDENGESSWPRGFGALTNKGIKRMYDLGQWLKERYIDDMKFLSPNNARYEVLIQSSNVPYTVESAQAVAAGLFPAEGSRVWMDGGLGGWQPFYIQVNNDSARDLVLRPAMYGCPPVDSDVENERFEMRKKFDADHPDLLAKLGPITGLAPVNFLVITRLYGIQTEIDHGLPQPDWVTEIYKGKEIIDWIREVKTQARTAYFNSKRKARMRAGVLLDTLMKYLLNAAYQRGLPKAVFSSTHDGTIFPLMYAMGISDGQLVQPGSVLLMELHEEEENYLVKLWWRNSTDELHQLALPSCELDCPLENFEDLLQPMRLEFIDVQEVCENAASNSPYVDTVASFLLMAIAIHIAQ